MSFHRMILWLGFVIIPLGWSSVYAVKATAASVSFLYRQKSGKGISLQQDPLVIQRSTQKHYLSYDIYIPFEDIYPVSGRNSNEITLAMQKACGKGRLYIWIPLKFRLPLIGHRILEWCLIVK